MPTNSFRHKTAGGYDYTVVLATRKQMLRANPKELLDGICLYGSQRILVHGDGPEIVASAVHELLHAEFPGFPEEYVCALERSIMRVVRKASAWECTKMARGLRKKS